MSRALIPVLALLALAAGATPAVAADWSKPAVLLTEACPVGFCSPAPDVAVSRHGTVVAAYRRDDGLRAFVRIGDRHGHFGAAQALPKAAIAAKVAVADDGTAVAAWAQKGQVRAAFRKSGGRFGHSVLIASLAGKSFEIDDVKVGLDASGRSGVVAWSDFEGRTLTTIGVRAIDAVAGAPAGAAQQVEAAPFAAIGDLAVNRAGQAALSWLAIDAQQQRRIGLVTRGATGFSAPQQVSAPGAVVDDPRAAIDESGAVAVAYTAVTVRGDAGARGVPTLRVRPAGAAAFGPELTTPAPHPNRVFNPVVGFAGGGRATLLFQEKTHPAGFSRAAPLKSAVATPDGTALGAPATLATAEIREPRLAAMDGGRLLAIWQRGSLVAARSNSAGSFHTIGAPQGTPDPFSDASGNRALAASGRYAAFIWGGGAKSGYVRISVRRF